MSNDGQTPEKPAEDAAAPKPEAPKTRKIVRRSGTTRDNPAFAEAPPGEAAAPAPAGEAGGEAPAAASAPEGAAAPAPARARATFDARAPRPRPGPGPSRPQRPARTGGGLGGDYRPPPARPIGARPIPGGSRAPAEEGDYRPPPARPVGARPIPGGSRAPAPEGSEHRERRPRPEGAGDRPHRGDRPARGPRREGDFGHRPRRDHAPRPEGHDAPKPAAAAPAPRPSAPAAKAAAPAPAPKPAAPRPMPVFIPLARAGQVAPASARPALTPKEALAAKTKAHAAKSGKPKATESAPPPSALDPALVSATADEAVAALHKAGDAAAALVEAWAAASNAAAVVEAAEADGVSSAARKAAKRALNVLRSRGVTIPERKRAAARVEEVAEVVEATFSPPDVQGTVVFTITKREASGRYHIAEVIVREPFGVLQAGAGWLSGSQLKENHKRALQGGGVAPVAVPAPWARYRIAEARRLNAASGVPVPLGFERCLELIEPAPAAPPPHPMAELDAEITAEKAAAAVPMSGRLYAEPEFRGWWPDRSALNDLIQKVGARLGPDSAGNQAAMESIFAEEVAAATDRFFSPEVRTVVAARLRDAAISIRARKDERAASEILALARAVTEAGLITSPPREIPFLITFFQAGLGFLAQQDGGRLRVPTQQQAG